MAEILHSLGIEWQALLAQMLAFLGLYWVLRKYLFGTLGDMLEERRKQYAEQRKEAEEALRKAQYLEQQHRAELAEFRAQRTALLEEATAKASRTARELTDQARREAEELLEKTRAELEREKRNALLEMRREVAKLAVEGAAKLLRRALTPDDQANFVEEFAKELEHYAANGSG